MLLLAFPEVNSNIQEGAEAVGTLANSFKKIMHFEVQQGAQLRP